MSPKPKLPSEYLFELVKFIFEDIDTYNLLQDTLEAFFKEDYLVWAYNLEDGLIYAIDPIKRCIYGINSLVQPPITGDLIHDEAEIDAVL